MRTVPGMTLQPVRAVIARSAKLGLTLLLVLQCSVGCWHRVPLTQFSLPADAVTNLKHLENFEVRLVERLANGQVRAVWMTVQKLAYPMVQGRASTVDVATQEGGWTRAAAQDGSDVEVDLRSVERFEVYEGRATGMKVLKYVGIGLGVTAVAALALLLLAVASGGCPFVYVDYGQGPVLAGVPYAGAVMAGAVRDDLLPLHTLPTGRVKMRQVNGGQYETEYTDRIEVLAIDHPPSLRALAAGDRDVVLVGAAVPPQRARNGWGDDVLDLLTEEDGRSTRADMERSSREARPALRDELTLDFVRRPNSGQPVLELVVATDPWLDLVAANYMQLFGDRLDEYLRDYKPDLAGTSVDLRVELEDHGTWRTVAIVPPPGLPRRIAVPLPAAADSAVRLRLSSGLGFWQLDAAAMSYKAATAPLPYVVAPSRAVGADGKDVRALLARTDGRNHVSRQLGEAMELEFELPELAPNSVRTAFFSTRGYYEVRPPQTGSWSPGELLAAGRDRDSFARYGLGLYKRYRDLGQRAGRK